MEAVASIGYPPILISDYSPVSLRLKLNNVNVRGRHWRLNASLLKEKEFSQHLSEQITKFFIESNDKGDVDDSMLWESLKAVIRGHII